MMSITVTCPFSPFRNAKQMPDSVRDALKEVIKSEGGKSDHESEEYIVNMDRVKRYQAETWS